MTGQRVAGNGLPGPDKVVSFISVVSIIAFGLYNFRMSDYSVERPRGEVVRELQALFNSAQEVVLTLNDGNKVSLPTEKVLELKQFIENLQAEEALTTQEAADRLGVSRPYLIKRMEEGALPYYMVGSHRRIRREDFEAFLEVRKKERREALDEISRIAAEMEAYEESEVDNL